MRVEPTSGYLPESAAAGPAGLDVGYPEYMATRSGTTVIVGVTGGIGAYKACELVRTLQRRGLRVKVAMTESAARFVTPLTFRTLTGEPVASSLWEEPMYGRVYHVSLAKEADVMVIAPCTANVIAKLAHGRADDMLTTTALACAAPLVLAPAMNDEMWRKDITQENLATLRARGVIVIEPEVGDLACGDVGEGRLAEVGAIADVVEAEAHRMHDLAGVRLLVTAGGTREPIDPVRFVGNRSSGRTGYAIAEEAARRGADVTLVAAPTALPDPPGVQVVRVTTALEMREAVTAAFDAAEAVVMTAAVADFRPATAAGSKLKKDTAPETIELVRTPDILAELGERKGRRVLVGFAAETDDVLGNARAKLAAKHLDMVVANDVSQPGIGFEADVNSVTFLTATTEESSPVLSKRAIAGLLLDRLATMLRTDRKV
jgi:phosphopantothenoylcysteine decarboxylase/phosphopantothenate--cysteine ligase